MKRSLLLLIGLLALLLRRLVIVPLKTVMSAALRIAEGDLSMQLEVTSRDETGQLMGAMKTMVTKLRQIIEETQAVVAAVNTLGATADALPAIEDSEFTPWVTQILSDLRQLEAVAASATNINAPATTTGAAPTQNEQRREIRGVVVGGVDRVQPLTQSTK